MPVLIDSAEQAPDVPDLTDAEPKHCGVEPEVGFGLAGGGYGAYTYCPVCGQILDKDQEE